MTGASLNIKSERRGSRARIAALRLFSRVSALRAFPLVSRGKTDCFAVYNLCKEASDLCNTNVGHNHLTSVVSPVKPCILTSDSIKGAVRWGFSVGVLGENCPKLKLSNYFCPRRNA